ncbi:MAG TPA: hypothetical protein VI636_12840 [Candidatus Angelobacter sp.]
MANHRWGFHGLVLFFAVVGVFVVVLAELRAPSPFWKDFGLIVGGLFIGFVSLSVDEHFRARPERIRARKEHEEERRQHEEEHKSDQDRIAQLQAQNQTVLDRVRGVQGTVDERERREILLSQTETDNAYYLGYLATALPMKIESFADNLILIRAFCGDLGIQFSQAEQCMLESASTEPSQGEKITEIVLSKETGIRPPLRCFFLLGNKAAWLRDQMENAHSSRAVLKDLEGLHSNPFLQLDPRYARVVDELLQILRPYRETIPDNARGLIRKEVLDALGKVPPIYVHGDRARIPVSSTQWIWVKDDDDDKPVAMRIIGKYGVVARNANAYEMFLRDNMESKMDITRDEGGWHCSGHPNATEEDACFEIRFVLDATDGG